MGNSYKLRLSWLYSKLRGPRGSSVHSPSTSRSTSSSVIPPPHAHPSPRKSYHFTRELAEEEPPVAQEPRRHVRSSCSFSTSTSTSDAATSRPRRSSPEFRFDRVLTPDPVDKTTSSSSTYSSSASRSLSDPDVVVGAVCPPGLSPILTTEKKKKKNKEEEEVVEDVGTERRRCSSTKRFFLSPSAKSPGMRIRARSPRLVAAARRSRARKRAAGRGRSGEETNGKCAGVAVVKSSFDPWRDFRDSMVEMIVENRIKESEDLEDLLMCYLTLNSDEYHEVIIAAFKQIWCELTDVLPDGNYSQMM